jgi:hypothetical protein
MTQSALVPPIVTKKWQPERRARASGQNPDDSISRGSLSGTFQVDQAGKLTIR